MTRLPLILSGLSEIAGDYNALVCDVWGVVHDGERPYPAAVEALRRFRAGHGRVVLLSNAPRLVAGVKQQFAGIGVPPDCYDAIVTSGAATREHLAARAKGGRLAMMHLGPERDRNVFEGLNVEPVGPDRAAIVLLTGFDDDETQTADDYRAILADLKARGLPMICANPDVTVQRGGRTIPCAGAIARAYEELGGEVVYYGKPHLPIFAAALRAAGSPKRALVVGDGLETDIRGANRAGLDALFIAAGIHGKEIGALTPESLAALFAGRGVTVRAAMSALAW